MATMLIGKADYFLTKEVSNALYLNSGQKEELRKDMERWLNQIKPQVKLIRGRLIAQKRMVSKGAASKDFALLQARQFGSLAFKAASGLTAALAKQMVQLDEEQQERFFKDWQKENDKLRGWIDKDKPDYPYSNFRTFFGKLTSEQKKLFKDQKAYFIQNNKNKLETRLRFEENLKRVFAEKALVEKEKKIQVALILENFLREMFKEEKALMYGGLAWELLNLAGEEQVENFESKSSLVIELLDAFLKTEY